MVYYFFEMPNLINIHMIHSTAYYVYIQYVAVIFPIIAGKTNSFIIHTCLSRSTIPVINVYTLILHSLRGAMHTTLTNS